MFNPNLLPKSSIEAIEFSCENNLPVLLVGETGTGKTSLVRYLANKNKKKFTRVNLNGATGTEELLGKFVFEKGETKWVYGTLIEAMKNGEWLLLDEINASTPETLFILHSLLDDDRSIQLKENRGEVIEPHKDFRFFASMNPNYSGTKELNKALLSRFPTIIDFDFPDPESEKSIIKIHTKFRDEKKMDTYIKLSNELRYAYKSGVINFVLSTRELISFCRLLDSGMSEKDAFNYSILYKCNHDERDVVLSIAKLFIECENPKSGTSSLVKENQKLKEQNEAMKRDSIDYKEFQENMASNKKIVDKAIKKEDYKKLSGLVNSLIKEFFGSKSLKYIDIAVKKKEKDLGF